MEKNVLHVIIETPKGSAEKYSYDKEHNLFKLKKILPSGMSFPYDFGFLPNTRGEDGDPLDVIVISEFKTFPGCLVECRIIGAMTAKQSSEAQVIRNDRFFAVSVLSSIFSGMKTVTDIPKDKLQELEQFFVNYNKVEGKKFKLLNILDPKEALALIHQQRNE